MALRTIMVTGSSGTIGTRLCEILLKRNYRVIGVDWEKNKWNPEVQKHTIMVDLRKSQALKKNPAKIDLIIHLAANARVYDLVEKPNLARDNFLTLFNVLEYARQNKIKKFIFASSREVYGNSQKTSYKEEDADVTHCESPYSASKIAGEALVRSFQRCFGIDFVIFRFSNVYGMYDQSNRVIPLFIRRARKNQDLVIFGRDKCLDFTYIDDTVKGMVSAVSRFDRVKNEVFNLAFGKGVTLIDIAGYIKKYLHRNVKILVKGNRTGEVIRYIANIDKARKKLNFQPKIDIQPGIQKSIQWYQENC